MGIMLSRKLRQSTNTILQHWCDGCHHQHSIYLTPQEGQSHVWTWDGNAERPTFNPSINIGVKVPIADGEELDKQEEQVALGLLAEVPYVRHTLCHYWITDGMIAYCEDTPHRLKGLTVELPDWPERYLFELTEQSSS